MAGNSLVFKIGADFSQFRSSMENVEKSMVRAGKKMQKMGKSMSTYVTGPLLALGAASVIAWDKQAKAIAQVEAGLKATGNAVGFTSEQLQSMASELQKTTLFGDEDILKNATSQLLTFTNIADEQFARTQKAALDLATRLDGDLKSASIQLGKALNDPVANLSALSRSGIQFSKEQKSVINALVKTNKLAEAQDIILKELEKQYGGSAEAAASAGLGGFQQLGNAVGDVSEDFGRLITEALTPVLKVLTDVVYWVNDLSETAKKWTLIIGGIVAAIGPLILVLGTIMTMAPIVASGLSAIAVAFNAINWPLVAIIAGIAAFVAIGIYMWDNWDAITQNLVKAWTWAKNMVLSGIIALVKGITWFSRTVLEALGFDALSDGVDFIVEKLEGLKDPLPEVTAEFGSFGESMSNVMEAVGMSSKDAAETIKESNDGTVVSNDEVVESFDKVYGAISRVKDSMIGIGKGVTAQAAMAGQGVAELDTSVENLNQTIYETGDAAAFTFDKFMYLLDENIDKIMEWGNRVKSVVTQVFTLFRMQMDNQIKQNDVNTNRAIANVNREVKNDVMTKRAGEEAKEKIIQKAAFQERQLRMKQFKMNKAFAIATAIINGALAVTQALTLPVPINYVMAGVNAGLVAAEVAVIASQPTPAFANGGLVFGPTMGLVGEGSGTSMSNPEVIAPLDKLKSFIGDGNNGVTDNVTVSGVLRGEDIYLSNKMGQLRYSNLV